MSGIVGTVGGIVGGLAGTYSEVPVFDLILGPVTFELFEIPASLSAGGDQILSVHKYPGGVRTVDTFGPDDHDITWSGVFTGPDAEDRCQQLDTLRRQGVAQNLDFPPFNYTVVIRSFTWDYERPWKIGYSIALVVVQDNVHPQTQQAQGDSWDSQINSDTSTSSENATLLSGVTYAPGSPPFGAGH